MQYYSVKLSTREIIEGPLPETWKINPLTEAIVTTNDDGTGLSDAAYYAAFRRRQYPSHGDQLDALWKGGADSIAMKAQVDAVKSKYPKPI